MWIGTNDTLILGLNELKQLEVVSGEEYLKNTGQVEILIIPNTSSKMQ